MAYNYTNPFNQSYPNITPQPTQTGDAIFVDNEQAVVQYPVRPGQTVTLFDRNNPVFYTKTADINGNIQPIRIFDYTERVQEQPEMVTKKDLEDLYGRIIAEINKNPRNQVSQQQVNNAMQMANSPQIRQMFGGQR